MARAPGGSWTADAGPRLRAAIELLEDASPEARADALMRRLADLDLPANQRRAIDVGPVDPGVGTALRAHFEQIVVVASQHVGPTPERDGVRVVAEPEGDLAAAGGGRFDLVRCALLPAVLDPAGARALVKRVTKLVAPGGALVLTLPVALPRRRLGLGRRSASKGLRTGRPDAVAEWLGRSGLSVVATDDRAARDGARVADVIAERPLDRRPRVVEGRHGRLFLDNDRNRVVAQHSGDLLLDGDALAAWRRLLEERVATLGGDGVEYAHLIAPNAHAVWEEDLPPDVPTGRTRPALQLLDALEGSRARVIYPLDVLRAARGQGRPYCATDTHWTAFGAFVGYEALLDALGDRPPVRRLRREDVEWEEHDVVGDLGARVTPRRSSPTVRATVRDAAAVIESDNHVRNNGRVIRFTCPAAPDARVLVLGDSFAYAMLRFLAETWRTVTFAHLYTLDPALLAAARPDLVVTVLNERFHITVPDDATGLSAAAWLERKRERGGVLTPEAAALYGRKLGWP